MIEAYGDAARLHPSRAWLHAQLAEAVEAPLWREACARLWSLRETMTHTHGEQRARLAPLLGMEQALCQPSMPE